MAIFRAFHTPKPRQYRHKPIYYSPEEEERREREERLGLNRKDDGEFHTSLHRGSFRQQRWDAPEETDDMKLQRRHSNVRLLVILAALFALAALLYLTV